MYTFKKDGVGSVRGSNRLYAKAHSKKETLEKLAEYLRNERNYSEKEIKRFIAKSFVEKVDCIGKADC